MRLEGGDLALDLGELPLDPEERAGGGAAQRQHEPLAQRLGLLECALGAGDVDGEHHAAGEASDPLRGSGQEVDEPALGDRHLAVSRRTNAASAPCAAPLAANAMRCARRSASIPAVTTPPVKPRTAPRPRAPTAVAMFAATPPKPTSSTRRRPLACRAALAVSSSSPRATVRPPAPAWAPAAPAPLSVVWRGLLPPFAGVVGVQNWPSTWRGQQLASLIGRAR